MGSAVNDYTTVDVRDIAIVHSDNGTPICYWVLDEHRAESKTLRFDSNGVFYFLFFFRPCDDRNVQSSHLRCHGAYLGHAIKALPYLVIGVAPTRRMVYCLLPDCSFHSNAQSWSQSLLACIYS